MLFCVTGNSLELPVTQKGTNVPMMRTRAKQKHVASDRARRENVPRHILFHVIENSLEFLITQKSHSLFWSKTLDRLRGITRIIECLEYRYDLSAI